MITPKKSCRWPWPAFLASTVILLAISWHFAGYQPSGMISLSDTYPLAIRADGTTLITGTYEGKRSDDPFSRHPVRSIRFLDLATGREVRPSLQLKKSEASQSTVMISGIQLSDNGQRLVVVETEEREPYFVTVFDLSSRAVIFEKTISFNVRSDEERMVQLSDDGLLLAWVTAQDEKQRTVVVWDLDASKERFHVTSPNASFQLSPDGKLLAMREQEVPEQFQLFQTTTGDLVHSIRLADNNSTGFSLFKTKPTFSPDSRFVAVDVGFAGLIQVFDTASGKQCFQTKGRSPQFLPGGSLLGVRNSSGPIRVNTQFEVPEIVAWRSDGWTEMGAFPYDLGVDFGGTIEPHPWPTGRANQFGLTYKTVDDPLPGSTKSFGSALGRSLGLNVPRGLALDVVDCAIGSVQTYHLDGPVGIRKPYPLPQVGKILIPQSGETFEVWDIPPRRTYAIVWTMAKMLGALGMLGYALRFVIRFAARRSRTPG